nr:hypothetical protein [uncultured Faecalimonas sp.]
MKVRIARLDSTIIVEIDGNRIKNVSNYKITSSANGETELELKISFESEFTEFEMLTNQKRQTS